MARNNKQINSTVNELAMQSNIKNCWYDDSKKLFHCILHNNSEWVSEKGDDKWRRVPRTGDSPASVSDITMDEVQGNLMAQLACEQEDSAKPNVRGYNVGTSDYSKHKIQPWDIWIEYKLNPFDADIIKRVLRHKKTDTRKMDYEKIIHICQERIRQIDSGTDPWEE